MQQKHDHQPKADQYITLKTTEQEIGITRVTLRKYLAQLGIEPRSWHIGDRSLYISQDEKERVKQLKEHPYLLEHLQQEQVRVGSREKS
jgi:hypothetical protein